MSGPRRGTALRRPARTARSSLAAAVLAVSVLVGCGGSPAPDGRPDPGVAGEDHHPGAGHPTVAAPSAGAAEQARLTGSDLAWLQLMIPMNDRTLLLLDLTAERAEDDALASFAERLAADHRGELEDLHALREGAGVPDTNPHEGHRMTGMVTDDQLADAAAEPPGRFDGTVTDLLREHLEHSRMVSAALLDAGSDEEALALARELVDRRDDQLADLSGAGAPQG
ncbi:hypothetical protein GCM10027160_15310 [Streptomyces calidiresistens]|uniref:DUF305 domain-containing protein n=1 Tax=Streptomyces calidiresistens TaxID=1485586 RepID=A0A7W3XY44_9ACTN|nr:DUF305 domain-containing protein [Streptomyces calidiresistens]MBB0231740.1 DUF305 domain-containing protein [Streptomyces calidiresistens]